MKYMKKTFFISGFFMLGVSLFAQTESSRIAAGAREQLADLLNRPAMAKPATATRLEESWYRLETDAHVFTDQVNVRQVAAMLLDINNMEKFMNGKKSKLTAEVVSRDQNATIVDFVSISIGPLGIQIETPYRASLTTIENKATRFVLELRQHPDDSASNEGMKNLYAVRYAEEVTINGKKYTYIRIYTVDEVNTGILPDAKDILEEDAFPVIEEALHMIIQAAKTK